MSIREALQKRRSIYGLKKDLPVDIEAVKRLVTETTELAHNKHWQDVEISIPSEFYKRSHKKEGLTQIRVPSAAGNPKTFFLLTFPVRMPLCPAPAPTADAPLGKPLRLFPSARACCCGFVPAWHPPRILL